MASWINKIEAANAAWMKNFAEGNAEGVGDMYTEECKVMPTGADVIVGRKGIAAYKHLISTVLLPCFPSPPSHVHTCTGASGVFGGAMTSGVKSVLLKTDDVEPLNATDTAYERGHYTFFKEDGSIADVGK